MDKKLFIFTEGGNSMGLGHLARCLALYQEAQSQGIDSTIIVNKLANGLGILNDESLKILFCDWQSIDAISGFDLKGAYCVVDSYLANADVYRYISLNARRALYFDDANRMNYPAGLLLNAHVTEKYQDIESLVGMEYVLVREPFLETKKNKTLNEVENIVISLGADLHGLTAKVIRTLLKNLPDVTLHLVRAKDSGESYSGKVIKHFGLSAAEIAQLVSECDIGIIPASQTAIEFCSVGTPFVCIKTADNQSLSWLLKNDIIKEGINWDDEDFEKKVLEQIKKLFPYKEREQRRALLQGIKFEGNAKRIIERLMK